MNFWTIETENLPTKMLINNYGDKSHLLIQIWKHTGKSLSEVLILESVNPQYDERLFLELQEKYKFRTGCVQILFWMSKQNQTSELVFFL